MGVARRLVVWLLGVILVLLSLHGVLTVRREVELFDSDTVRDHEVLGWALAVAVARVWQTEGSTRALGIMGEIAAQEGSLRARWVGAGQVGADDAAAQALRTGQIVHAEKLSADGQLALFSYVPTKLAQGVTGLIELREPTAERDAYVHATILRTAGATVGLGVLCAGLMFALGAAFVGRPVHALVDQARRIGSGDLDSRTVPRRHDEIGELTEEINRMAERLGTARDQIDRETRERIRALEQLRHADRLATVGKLAAGIAHELGTPLNVISGRAKMIQQRSELPDPVRDNARIVREQSERMAKIIRGLLDFARAGKAQRTDAQLGDIARQTVALLASVADKKRVRLTIDEQPDLPSLRIDVGQIQQVLANLLVNAIHAMAASGEVRVEIQRVGADDPALGTRRGEHIRLSVVDEGAGMAPEVQGRIFEPFYTTKGVGEGTGLGLSVAWGIVSEHGGFIDVESEPGRGSRFSVWLPTTSPRSPPLS